MQRRLFSPQITRPVKVTSYEIAKTFNKIFASFIRHLTGGGKLDFCGIALYVIGDLFFKLIKFISFFTAFSQEVVR
jgi:hypothetical protein